MILKERACMYRSDDTTAVLVKYICVTVTVMVMVMGRIMARAGSVNMALLCTSATTLVNAASHNFLVYGGRAGCAVLQWYKFVHIHGQKSRILFVLRAQNGI
jgi:hypothetical protein